MSKKRKVMNKNKGNEQPFDPELIEKIELMRPTPDRDPRLVAQGRERFLAELEGIPAASSQGWLAGLFKIGTPGTGGKNRKFAFSTILALIVVAVMLFGGASATAYASQSALPGDALYPIKTGLELTQISLANDAYLEAQLHLEFAQRRMNEIKELLLQGRSSDVEFASSEFEYYIQQAMEATQTVIAADPERGAELSKLVSQALLDYAVALKSVLLNVPDAVKPAVEKALLISEDGVGDEIEVIGIVVSISNSEVEIDGEIYLINDLTEIKDLIEVGDAVKVHAILTADGSLIAREIEMASEFNGEGSEIGDDNSNSNGGFPGDNDNDNENMNDNESDDESDENMNDNESDENKNDNESDDNESNDNMNDNESDEDEYENENDDKSGSDKNDNDESDDNDNKSEDSKNDNTSDDNDNDSNDNDSEDHENSNESDGDKEENDNGD
jgi:hypothetical protein